MKEKIISWNCYLQKIKVWRYIKKAWRDINIDIKILSAQKLNFETLDESMANKQIFQIKKE